MKKKKADAPTMSLYNAYIAGFMASGEGWNGEYPYENQVKDAAYDDLELLEAFKTWWHSVYEHDAES